MRQLYPLVIVLLCWGCNTQDKKSASDDMLAACEEVPADTPISLKSQHLFAVGLDLPEDVPPIGYVWNLVVDDNGNLYVDESKRLIAFDAEGRYRWHLDEGEGPGEVSRLYGGTTLYKDMLILSNLGGNRFDRVSTDGRYISSTTAEELGVSSLKMRGTLHDSILVATENVWGAFGISLHLLSAETLELIASFQLDQGGEGLLPKGVGFDPGVDVVDDEIVIRNSLQYEMGFYTEHADTIRIVRRDIPDYTRPGTYQSGNSSMSRGFSGVGAPIQIAGGYRIVSGHWPTNVPDPDAFVAANVNGQQRKAENHRTIDIYDESWCYRGSVSPPVFDGQEIVDLERVRTDGVVLVQTNQEASILHGYRVWVEE